MEISPEIVSLIDEIKNDKVHGASQLARQAVNVLKVSAERSQAASVAQFLEELMEVGQKLMSARPAMAPIFNIVSRFLDAVSGVSPEITLEEVKSLALAQADDLTEASLQATARIASYGSGLIADGDRIMTHSYSSTVIAVLKEAFARDKHIEVIITRSGAGGAGQGITQELGHHRPLTLIDDAAMGHYISGVNKAIVGTDRVCADGNIVNGVGTYQLAQAAEKAGVPFYVLGETLKFDPRLKSDQVDLEERLLPQAKVKSPSFDITPLELVSGVVTENGLLKPEAVIDYLKKLAEEG